MVRLEDSKSLREPQEVPADHCYTVLMDFGPNGGGWGPASLLLPWMDRPCPFVYTGRDENLLETVRRICRHVTQENGVPTRLVRFTVREDVEVFGGSS